MEAPTGPPLRRMPLPPPGARGEVMGGIRCRGLRWRRSGLASKDKHLYGTSHIWHRLFKSIYAKLNNSLSKDTIGSRLIVSWSNLKTNTYVELLKFNASLDSATGHPRDGVSAYTPIISPPVRVAARKTYVFRAAREVLSGPPMEV